MGRAWVFSKLCKISVTFLVPCTWKPILHYTATLWSVGWDDGRGMEQEASRDFLFQYHGHLRVNSFDTGGFAYHTNCKVFITKSLRICKVFITKGTAISKLYVLWLEWTHARFSARCFPWEFKPWYSTHTLQVVSWLLHDCDKLSCFVILWKVCYISDS